MNIEQALSSLCHHQSSDEVIVHKNSLSAQQEVYKSE